MLDDPDTDSVCTQLGQFDQWLIRNENSSKQHHAMYMFMWKNIQIKEYQNWLICIMSNQEFRPTSQLITAIYLLGVDKQKSVITACVWDPG